MTMKLNRFSTSVLCLLLALNSCTTTKNMTYFQNIPQESGTTVLEAIGYVEPKIIPGDLLNITVNTLDPQATIGINQPLVQPAVGNVSFGNTGMQQISGYVVDKDGNIHLNFIGKVLVAGLTLSQARDKIEQHVASQFKNPVVNVGFSNFRISILGEVHNPGIIVFPNQKVNILDAIGMAGDLSIYGKRENVMLIRKKNVDGKEQLSFNRIDLNSTEFIASSNYWLENGDIIYVEPTKGRTAANNTDKMQLVSIVSSITSSVAMTITIILNLSKE